jgi:ribose transport system permease protein/L-arabinose transport system permease protein
VSGPPTTAQPVATLESGPRTGVARRIVTAVGVDNLSLILALVVIVGVVIYLQPLFLTWQNLMNSLAQSIVIVGLLAIGETVVIVGGMLDISVGSIASVASVASASVVVFGFGVFGLVALLPSGVWWMGLVAGIVAGLLLGLVNGLIVTKLNVNPIIATLGTLAAFAGLAFLLAPAGKPIGVVTQPDFTWLSTGRFLQELPIPSLGSSAWTGIPVLTVILLVVAVVFHVIMRYTDFGRSVYAIGGNANAARLAGIDLTRMRIGMYMMSGGVAGLAGVLLTARTTSGNPINGVGFELQAITAVFLGGAATTGGKGTIVGTLLAVMLVGVLNNGMNLLGVGTFYQKVALGALLIGAVALAQWRQSRAERARTRVAAGG